MFPHRSLDEVIVFHGIAEGAGGGRLRCHGCSSQRKWAAGGAKELDGMRQQVMGAQLRGKPAREAVKVTEV